MTRTTPDAPLTSVARSLRGRAFCRLRSEVVGALAKLFSALPRLALIQPAQMIPGIPFGLSWSRSALARRPARWVQTLIKGRVNRRGTQSPRPKPRRQPRKSGRRLSEWRSIRALLVAAFQLLALFAADSRQPQAADGLSEAQIKAAYLYNFAKFVEWPEAAEPVTADINLCVVGNNVLDGALQSLDGRKAGERSLKVTPHSSADTSLADCHLLFVGVSEQQRMVPILKNLGSAPVLTLSDIADFAEKGGGIALLFRDNKVVFEVNLESIRNAGLRLPGQLLNIATHVYGR